MRGTQTEVIDVIDFEYAGKRVWDTSDEIDTAVSNLTDQFFNWKIETPDKCTPELEQEFASLVLDWRFVVHQMVACGAATKEFLNRIDDEDAGD